MSRDSLKSKNSLFLTLVLLPLLFFSIYTYSNFKRLADGGLHNYDRSLITLSVESAKRGEAYSGAFSHAGFRHPGPVYFYYLAAAENLFPFARYSHGAFRFATLAFHLGILIVCMLLARRLFACTGRVPLMCLAFWAATYYRAPPLLTDYWNPYPNISLSLLFMLTAVGVAQARLLYLPLFVLSGSFLVQNHIGAVPFVGAIGLLAFVFCLKRWKLQEPEYLHKHRWSLWLSAVLFFLLWLPPLYQILTAEQGGNLGRVLEAFGVERKGKSFKRAFWLLRSFYMGPFKNFIPLHGIYKFTPIFVVLLTPLLCWRLLSKQLREFYIFLIIASIVSSFAIKRIFVPLDDYLVSYYYGLAAGAFFIFLFSLTEFIDWIAAKASFRSALPVLAFVIILCAGGLIFLKAPQATFRAKDSIEEAAIYVKAPPLDSELRYRLVLENRGAREFVAHLATALVRSGIDICVDAEWTNYFGYELGCALRQDRDPRQIEDLYFRREKQKGSLRSSNSFQQGKVIMRW